MASGYILKHPTTAGAGAATAGGPWVYLAVRKVTMPLTNQLIRIPRPDTDVRMRRRATREKKITIQVDLVGKSGEIGVDAGAGIAGGGKTMQEALESAWQTWKASGAIRLVLGTDSAGAARNFDGLIENVTLDWEPAMGDDDADGGNGARSATITFVVGTVSS